MIIIIYYDKDILLFRFLFLSHLNPSIANTKFDCDIKDIKNINFVLLLFHKLI